MSSAARARQSEQAVRHRSSPAIRVADGLQVVHFSGPSQCGQASRPPRPLRRATQRRLRRSVDGHGVPSSVRPWNSTCHAASSRPTSSRGGAPLSAAAAAPPGSRAAETRTGDVRSRRRRSGGGGEVVAEGGVLEVAPAHGEVEVLLRGGVGHERSQDAQTAGHSSDLAGDDLRGLVRRQLGEPIIQQE